MSVQHRAMEEAMNTEGELNDGADYDSSGEFSFHQGGSKYVDPNWILLDSQSKADIFCNPALLTNIRDAGKSIKVHCSAGTSIVTQVGTLKNYERYGTTTRSLQISSPSLKSKEDTPYTMTVMTGTNLSLYSPQNKWSSNRAPPAYTTTTRQTELW
jgi:hypothetical protein